MGGAARVYAKHRPAGSFPGSFALLHFCVTPSVLSSSPPGPEARLETVTGRIMILGDSMLRVRLGGGREGPCACSDPGRDLPASLRGGSGTGWPVR